ncbi:MAG: hypothetical protein SGARI_007091, partial [Bacillariaceae sp.]
MVDDFDTTLLVPSNDRFNVAELNVEHMMTAENLDSTTAFVKSHMMQGVYSSEQVLKLAGRGGGQFWATSKLGTTMWLSDQDGVAHIQGVQVLIADQLSRNGIFHVIDYPILPSSASEQAWVTSVTTKFDTSDCFRMFQACGLSSQDISDIFGETLTVFCPTNNAFATMFATMNQEDIARLTNDESGTWYRHACDFVLGHITAPAAPIAEVRSNEEVLMLNGDVVSEDIFITVPDISTSDGYLNVIENVLLPSSVTDSIYDRIEASADHSVFKDSLDLIDMTESVSRELPLTVVAMDNASWNNYTNQEVAWAEYAKEFIFRGLFFCDVLATLTNVEDITGATHDIAIGGDSTVVIGNQWRITECDVLARNG